MNENIIYTNIIYSIKTMQTHLKSHKNFVEFTKSIGLRKFFIFLRGFVFPENLESRIRPFFISVLLVGLFLFFVLVILFSIYLKFVKNSHETQGFTESSAEAPRSKFAIFGRHEVSHETREGFNTNNNEYTYYPKKVDRLQDVSAKFFINDFIRDVLEVPECIKIYKQLMPASDPTSANAQPEYTTQSISDTNIYKKYNSGFLDETKGDEMMNHKFGVLFKKETFIVPNTKSQVVELKDFKKKVEEIMDFENKLHNFIKYSTIQPFDAPFSFTEFSDYFATVLYKYREKPQQLEQIKTFVYKLIRPLYLYSKFIEHFIANQKVYTEKDDILYVLNETSELLKKVKIEEFSHSSSDKNVYIFQEDSENVSNKTLTVDSLTIFSMVHILLQLRKVLRPDGSKFAQISDDEFSSIFQTYLNKKFPTVKTKSIICYGLKPSNTPTLVNG